MKPKNLTNTELVKQIMTSYGPIGEVFVILALTAYSESQSKLKPEDLDQNSIINPHVWIEISKNIKNDLDNNYRR